MEGHSPTMALPVELAFQFDLGAPTQQMLALFPQVFAHWEGREMLNKVHFQFTIKCECVYLLRRFLTIYLDVWTLGCHVTIPYAYHVSRSGPLT
jgi:hypothetical protein